MSATVTPLTGTYAADPVHSTFGFAVRYQGISLFRGTLDDVTATLAAGRLDGSAKVESISIRTPQQFRDHVLSPEFFDAEEHPEVRFASSELDLREDGSAAVLGDLTIRGVTRSVRATGTWAPPTADAFGGTRVQLTLETTIDRTAFGMTWNAPLPSGGKALGDDVTLTLDIAFVEEA